VCIKEMASGEVIRKLKAASLAIQRGNQKDLNILSSQLVRNPNEVQSVVLLI
jgi:hypothetical protein